MPKPDILVAEDDEVLLRLYEKKFSLAGFAVRTAGDGQEAIRMLGERKPDLLILDVRMPIIDGLQVLREFPKKLRTFPIIILTNFHDDGCKDTALELGADAYIVKKDTNMKKLLEIVENLLKR